MVTLSEVQYACPLFSRDLISIKRDNSGRYQLFDNEGEGIFGRFLITDTKCVKLSTTYS